MSEATFPPTFTLLLHEANLAQGILAIGLTSLRRASVDDKPSAYSGFFNTTIGLERLMKLIVVTDYMLRNELRPPSKSALKAYGHDLSSLFASCVAAGNTLGIGTFQVPAAGSIEADVLQFFTHFAQSTRYHNLDSLGGKASQVDDPLTSWDRILQRVLQSDTRQSARAAKVSQAQATQKLLAPFVHALRFDMHGAVQSTKNVFLEPSLHRLAIPHAMVRVSRLVRPLAEIVSEIGTRAFYSPLAKGAPPVPAFSEFFVYFQDDDSSIRKKRRWP